MYIYCFHCRLKKPLLDISTQQDYLQEKLKYEMMKVSAGLQNKHWMTRNQTSLAVVLVGRLQLGFIWLLRNFSEHQIFLPPTFYNVWQQPRGELHDLVLEPDENIFKVSPEKMEHSRLSWSSADDFDDVRPWSDVGEVRMPLLQFLCQPECKKK